MYKRGLFAGVLLTILCITGGAANAFAQSLGGAVAITSATAPDGSVRPWRANLVLRNPSAAAVSQKIGHITFTAPGCPSCSPIVTEPTVTVDAGETLRITNAGRNFDACEPVATQATGLCQPFWTLAIDSHLEAYVALTYGEGIGSTNFEMTGVGRPLFKPAESIEFHAAILDANPDTASGAWLVFMNTNGFSVPAVVRVYASKKNADGTYDFKDEFTQITSGVSLYPVHTARPSGATVQVCDTACNVGVPGSHAAVYTFMLTGRDGSVRAPRYPLAPGS